MKPIYYSTEINQLFLKRKKQNANANSQKKTLQLDEIEIGFIDGSLTVIFV